jgi:rod shape-determining protein MreC
MPGPSQGRIGPNRFPIDSDAIAEVVFLLIVFYLILGPLGGFVLSSYATVSGLFAKANNQVESSRNLANQLFQASDRINKLESRVADQQLELTKLRQEAGDTQKLRSLLGLKQKLNRKTIGADVVAREPDNWFSQVAVDKGFLDGVRTGSAVVTNEGVVGQIVKVGDHASVVRLLTDPDQKVGVLISRTNVPGVLSGRKKNPPSIDFVPVGTAVDVHDKVTCLGNGGVFPVGHPVGEVTLVRRDTNGTTLTIEVKPSDSLYDLTHVLIVPPLDQY